MENNNCPYCFEKTEDCICVFHKCIVCKREFPEGELYEYRGAIACSECFEKAQEKKDIERTETIIKNKALTDKYKGLDMSSNSVIGKANREIMGVRG